MIRKMIANLSDSYITLVILIPYIMFYLNGFYPKYSNNKIIPVLLVLIYIPTLIWSLTIRDKDTTAKYHIGAIKLLFSLNVLPLVSFIFINFSDANYVNTINIYIIFMTALFFTLDGQTDLIDSFKQTKYNSHLLLGKLAFEVFNRLLRRFVFFFGGSLLIAIWYLVVMTNFHQHYLNYSVVKFSIINSVIQVIGTFIFGWISLALVAHKRIRAILEEKLIFNEHGYDGASALVNLLHLPKNIKFLVTGGPLIFFASQFLIMRLLYSNLFITEAMIINLTTGIITYAVIIFIQHLTFRRYKFF